jgi:hypothetical protein
MVLDNERCNVVGCDLHKGWVKTTPFSVRNEQIRDDWASGVWTLEELSSFWGLKPLVIMSIVRGAYRASARPPALQVVHSR